MEDYRLPKQLLNYYPKGRWRPGWTLKRLFDSMTAETETGHPGLNSWWNMIIIIIMMMMMMMTYLCYFIYVEKITKLYNNNTLFLLQV
jgi:hypothetical protein